MTETPDRYVDTPVTPAEADLIMADLRELRERPPPSDPSAGGCLVAFLALGGLIALPLVGPALSWGPAVTRPVAIVLAIALGVGSLLRVFGGGFARGAVFSDVEEAVDQLVAEFPDGDERVIRQGAIRILDGASVSYGPTTTETFEPDEMALRLGPALPYVARIERFLLEKEEIYPVFT